MAVPERDRLSADDFLRWVVKQDQPYELVDGRVLRMMTGAKQSHNTVTINMILALGPQLRRGDCRPTANDTAVRTSPHSIRYPDIVVDCSPPDPDALEVSCPTFVAEVSSPSTTTVDATDKLDEYRARADIRIIALVEPDIVSFKLYRRDGAGEWQVEWYDDLSSVVELPEIGASLPLAEVYYGLRPVVRPKLTVVGDEAAGTPPR